MFLFFLLFSLLLDRQIALMVQKKLMQAFEVQTMFVNTSIFCLPDIVTKLSPPPTNPPSSPLQAFVDNKLGSMSYMASLPIKVKHRDRATRRLKWVTLKQDLCFHYSFFFFK